MTDWIAVIKENKRKVSDSTVKTYNSSIKTYLKHVNKSDVKEDYFNDHASEVMKSLANYPYGKRKNLLSSFIAVTTNEKALSQYKAQMMKDIQTYNNQQKEQTMSNSQEKNWISQDEVKTIYNKLDKEVAPLWLKDNLRWSDLKKLMGFVALSVYVLIPPRRISDYVYFKVKNVSTETDNYMTGRKFVFNRFKTAKTYGKQEVPIPYKLHSIISRWKNKHDSDYLIFNKNGGQLQPSKLTLLLNSVFDKKISANMLRHIFISDKLKDVPAIKELESLAEDMGHSQGTQMLYKKTNTSNK